MPVATGQDARIYLGTEGTWGTVDYTTDESSNLPFESVSWGIRKDRNVVENINASPSIRSVAFGNTFVEATVRSVLDYDNFLAPLYCLFGLPSNGSLIGASTFQWNFALTTTAPPFSIVIEHLIQGDSLSLSGCKITRASFNVSTNEGMRFEFTAQGKVSADEPTPTQPAQVVSEVLVASDVTSFQASGETQADACLRDFTVNWEQPFDTDQACIGGSGELTSEPGRSGPRNITIDATIAYENTAHWLWFTDGTTGATSIGFTGPGAQVFNLSFPKTQIVDWTEPIDGGGRIYQRVSYQALQSSAANDEATLNLTCATDKTFDT